MTFTKLSMVVLAICLMPIPATAETRPETAAEMGIMQGSPPTRVIDIASWDKGPDNRWAFQHISEIVPVATISRGNGPAAPLGSSLKDLSGFSFNAPNGRETTIQEMLVRTYTDGFIVLHKGEIVFEKYYNGMTPDTRHLLMSVSKSVTGALAGILVDDARLKPDAWVTDYIPELKDAPGFGGATVRQILDMTTAIVFSEDYADPNAEVVAHEAATGWRGANAPMRKRPGSCPCGGLMP